MSNAATQTYINNETGSKFRFSVEEFIVDTAIFQDDLDATGRICNSTPLRGGFETEQHAIEIMNEIISQGVSEGAFTAVKEG